MSYIKFQRGNLAAYEALTSYDENTLYFVTPEQGEGNVGRLYLGKNLISGGDVVLQYAELSQLADVIVEGAGTGDFLVHNAEGNWVHKSAAEVAAEVLATLKVNSTLAYDESGVLGIAGFATAENGSQLIKTSTGEFAWVKPNTTTVEGLETTVTEIQESVESLGAQVTEIAEDVTALEAEVDLKANAADVYAKSEVDTLVANAVANAEHLKRILVDKLPEAEVADAHAIYMIPKEGGSDSDVCDEYMVVNGAWEKIGNTAVNLDGYVTEDYVTEAIGAFYTKTETNALLDAKVNTTDLATELNKKVNAVEGSRLMTEAEGTKLAGIAEGAEVNVINAVSEDFIIGENRTLILNNISTSKIVDLETLLNNKANKTDVEALNKRVGDLEGYMTWTEMVEPTR